MLAVEFEVIATASDGKSALDLVRRYEPDLVVLDLRMPGLDGIEVTREVVKCSRGVRVVICLLLTEPEIVEAARDAGASAYVFKARIGKELILAMRSVLRDRPFLSPSVQW
jgi:DNA-binding NarL/FixJ family response regulator